MGTCTLLVSCLSGEFELLTDLRNGLRKIFFALHILLQRLATFLELPSDDAYNTSHQRQ